MDMSLQQHVNLLRDWDRGLALRSLIQETVQPGMRVLDAGSGSGLLSLWAAQAGAEVIAIDRTEYPVATVLAQANGLAEKIDFRQADLTQVTAQELGGPVDLLLAMIYWNDPRRDEVQSRIARGLKERCLKPDGRAIPEKVAYRVEVCEWQEQELTFHQTRDRDQQGEFLDRYGLDFAPLFDYPVGLANPEWFPRRDRDHLIERPKAKRLTEVGRFEIDYDGETGYPTALDLTVEHAGSATTAVWTQDLLAGRQLIFRNESVSWLSPTVSVSPGGRLRLGLGDRWREHNILESTAAR